MIGLSTIALFYFLSFPLPLTCTRVQNLPASMLLQGPRERSNILQDWCRNKLVRECRNRVKWTNLNLAHSRSCVFHFAKLSALHLRLSGRLSPLSGSRGISAEVRALSRRQGCAHAWLLAAFLWTMLPCRKGAWPAGTAILAERPAADAQHRTSCTESPPTAVKLTKNSPFVPTLRF